VTKQATLQTSEVVAVVTALSFALTILYLLGFSHVLGVSLFRFFALTDYLRLALVWLPPVALFLLAREFAPLLSQWLGSQPDPPPRFKGQPRWAVLLTLAIPILLLTLSVSAALWPRTTQWPYSSPYWIWQGSAPLLWWYFAHWLLERLPDRTSWTPMQRLALILVPALCLLAYMRGSYEASIRTAQNSPIGEVRLNNPDALIQTPLFLSLEDWLITYDLRSHSVVIHGQSRVSHIRFAAR